MMWYRILHWTKRILIFLAAYATVALLIFTWQMLAGALRDPDADLVDKTAQDTADRLTLNAEIVESVRKLVNIYRTPEYQRDAHAKAHGCVRATFEVFESEDIYNHGIFQTPGTYEAWIRFSNGSVPSIPDNKGDARGMAIKVMNVPGQQLLPAPLTGKSQDFVMVNSPAFFVRSIENYRDLEHAAASNRPFSYFLGKYYVNPFQWNLRQLYLGLKSRKKAPPTPLSTQYYSMSPYNLGPHQMKYSAKSCEIYDPVGVDKKDPNLLREGMKRVLRSRDACFQFMVQLRDPDARMPIQDTTVVWSEKKSPFVPVARVHIPKQEFDTPKQNEMCEDMSFNPWHAVEGLEPINYLNELRRDLYLHTAAYRRVKNAANLKEPKSWCDSLPEYCKNESPTDDSDANSINASEDGDVAEEVETTIEDTST